MRSYGEPRNLDLTQVSQGHAEGASVETSPVLKVKYLTYKNIATIAREQGDFSAALEAYIQVGPIKGCVLGVNLGG